MDGPSIENVLILPEEAVVVRDDVPKVSGGGGFGLVNNSPEVINDGHCLGAVAAVRVGHAQRHGRQAFICEIPLNQCVMIQRENEKAVGEMTPPRTGHIAEKGELRSLSGPGSLDDGHAIQVILGTRLDSKIDSGWMHRPALIKKKFSSSCPAV